MERIEISPGDIERKSMEIIAGELGERDFDESVLPIVKRVIHTTADFDFADNLFFSEGVTDHVRNAFMSGASVVTDTNMALTGINKGALGKLGGRAYCFMADEEVASEAAGRGMTRAYVSMERSAMLPGEKIYAIGNAPTALMSIDKMIKDKALRPALVIAVPVGFVNVEYAKEQIKETCCKSGIPIIAAMGRKGGSAVAAAIVNALMYMMPGVREQ